MTEDERVERFEAAYNRIDRALTDLVSARGNRRKHGFSAKVRVAANRRRRFAPHADFLLEIGELRNALVHSRTGNDFYIAVPHEKTVLELERIERRLFSPERVIPRFKRAVHWLRTDQTLAEAWTLIRDDGYSTYPVYDRSGFQGLLTTNGLARWCAAQMKDERLEVDASAVHVADLLAADHRRDHVEFISRDTLVDDAEQLFIDQARLEAVLITDHGRRDEKPIGLISPRVLAGLE